ncbi:hypothetical protein [Alloalcanivorax gelatiniphagus]|nr:hypothetical protein [Alloalcanivorax gelatiniphagus]|tara:strand:+ start:6198 stop:7184 length:987 start_codon:yes stop_codon:yes gene_type:complete
MANKQDKADRLLDALIAHVQETLDPERVDAWLEGELDFLLAWAEQLTLGQVVSAEQVRVTARKYAIEVELGGGIPELVGEMVERFYDHGILTRRRVGEVVDEATVVALMDKLLEIPLSRQGIGWLSRNPVLLAVLAGGTQLGLKTWLHQGLPAPVRALIDRRLPPRWRAGLELRLQDWLQERMAALLADPWLYSDDNLEALRELVLVAWQEFAERPLEDLRELVDSEDIQELFVIGYDFWRDFRHSDYFAALLDAGVDAFFDKYSELTLRELIDEVGLTREHLLDDALRFGPPAVRILKERGILEDWLRRQLEPFFAKPETLAIIGEE